MEKNLTSGSVLKTVIYFSLPYLLSYFLQTLYGMADLFIIGQFGGVDGTTAVSVGSQVMHMLTVMIVGLAMGATVLIGRAVGAGDRKLAARGIGNTISLFAGLSILLTGLLLTTVHGIIRLLSVPEEAVNGTAAYLMICFAGIRSSPPTISSALFSAAWETPKVRCISLQSPVLSILRLITF